ncbi:hypothetical protein GTY65_00990 [Streptomyces sp. SID8379]|uniref:hypothetical protein n=1 Tax=unclassified Streptomyces TaxID=2593676 RepID=UPI00037372BC|nr:MULTISPECIES: hypothetical protein [unclassified Streptomyces]MYW62661.1 hypothetical protein [Streptomyces sp. SID8379]
MSTAHDFDFFFGEWDVTHRRRLDFLDPESGWEEFGATSSCRPLFGGAANIDEMPVPARGWTGMTLRLFDPVTRLWSLNWSTDRTGRLFPPVHGRFAPDGRGEFVGADTHDGKDVRVRFTWSGISATTARWEQAFSVDGDVYEPDEDRTWLVNWSMDFTRRATGAAPRLP